MTKRILYAIPIGIGFGFLLLLSVWMHLSPQRLTPWLVHRLNGALPGKLHADIATAKPVFASIALSKIRLYDRRTNGEIVRIDAAEVSFNPIRLLVNLGVPYSIELYRGRMEGVFRLFPTRTDFRFDNLRPNGHAELRKRQVVQSSPTLAGRGSISLSPSGQPNGRLDFRLEDLALTGEKKGTELAIDLPSTAITLLSGSLHAEGEKLDVEVRSAGDIAGTLKGTVLLDRKVPDRSKIDLTFDGRLEKRYKNRLDELLKQFVQFYSNAAGQIKIKINGTVKNPGVQKS